MTLPRPRPALPILAGPSDLLPNLPEKRNERGRRGKKTFCLARAQAPCSSIPSVFSEADPNSTHASLSPPPVAGAPRGVPSGVEGAAVPRTLCGGEGDLHPKPPDLAALHWCPLCGCGML